MLFIDDHGKVVSFKYVRGLLISFICVILALLAVSFYFYYLQKSTLKKNSALQYDLAVSQQETKALQQEMRDLMFQLAEAQSSIRKSAALENTKPEKEPSEIMKRGNEVRLAETRADNQKKIPSEKSRPVKKTSGNRTPAETPSEVGPKEVHTKKEEPPAASEKKQAVEVSEFFAYHDHELNALNVRFLIKKSIRSAAHISGHIFVIMKENDLDQKKWFPMPSVELASGKPSHIKEGQFFKIRNYKTVHIRSLHITGPKTFNHATLLVFTPSGELFFEKTYPVKINVAEIPAQAAVSEAETSKPTKVSPEPEKNRPAEAVKEGPGLKKNSEEIILNEVPMKSAGKDPIPAVTE